MTSDEDLSRFIASSFRSVWALEILLLLKRTPGVHQTGELIVTLRASELVLSRAIETLTAVGLTVTHADGGVAYSPASDQLAQLTDLTEELYERRPDAVRRMIVADPGRGVTACADAFRLRKD